MKLSMACVAVALSLTAVACADEVATSGDTEISVKDTNYKADQDPLTRTVFPGNGVHGEVTNGIYDFNRIFFADQRGVSAESLSPMDFTDTNMCGVSLNVGISGVSLSPINKSGLGVQYPTLIVQHTNNGNIDIADVMMEDGTFVCRIVQTPDSVLSSTCPAYKKPPAPVGGGVGGC